jgi:hypothetical protein
MKLKMIAIAAAAASLSGVAHANLTVPGSNNGSVALVAVDITTNNWYIRDTGFFLNSFLPSSVTTTALDGGGSAVTGDKTPAAGLTLDKTNTTSFADASFSGWLAAQSGTSNIRWIMTGYDAVTNLAGTNSRRMLASSANPNETISNDNVDIFAASSGAGGLSSLFGTGTLSKTGTGGPAAFLNAFSLGTDAMGTLDQGSSLFYAGRSASGSNNPTASALVTKFGNASGFATVTLESDGDFTYVLAGAPVGEVPLPAAVWMMGAGLAAIGSVVRRRKAAAQA